MMKRSFLHASILALCLALIAASGALAQPATTATAAPAKSLAFGPPLRPNIVFSYKFTERVRAIYESGGAIVDSGGRELSYYISAQQTPLPGGRWSIEANVDSMRVDYLHNGQKLHFNTQEAANENFDINHREILAPSAIVNRVAMIGLSPYGELISIESPSFDFLREQIADPAVDASTRERVQDLISPEFLSATLLPWRSIAPLGRTVRYDVDTLRVPFYGVLDRIPVRDTARVYLMRQNDKPVLGFTADFTRASRKVATFTELLDPVTISAIDGKITGALNLDDDGVVVSGWTTAKGTVNGVVAGLPVLATVWHETYTEMIGMMTPTNN
jgi:hypothetical protein